MKKEELRNVDGTDSLHPNRSGDVVVVLRPPYQFDAATPGQRIALLAVLRPARLPAQPGRSRAQRQHARDVRRGRTGHPQARTPVAGRARDRRRADDRVPDGHPRPAERARQDPLQPRSRTPGSYKEITILDISDYHGQLMPLPEAADNLAGAGASTRRFAIGGVGVPQAVVRRLPRRGDRADSHHGRRRRLGRGDAADLGVLRRHADDRDHEPDGLRRRRARQPQLRQGAGVPARTR